MALKVILGVILVLVLAIVGLAVAASMQSEDLKVLICYEGNVYGDGYGRNDLTRF